MNNFSFRKYPSITNSYQEKSIEYIEMAGLSADNIEWSVSEKIHGASLGVYCDGISVQYASRSQFINDSFFGLFDGLSDEYEPKVLALFNSIKKLDDKVESILLYGELFGGSYPHNDVEKLKGVSKVQGKVYYSPKLEISAFDIYVEYAVGGKFLDVDVCNKLFAENDIFYCEEIFRGTFTDVLKYSDEFESTIPARLGLPLLESNICEGIVIKPVIAVSYNRCESRIVLKSKNIKFTEKSKPIRTNIKELSPEQSEAVALATSYLNMNRLDNVLSKNGDANVPNQLIGKYIGLLVQDAIEDLNIDCDAITKLQKSDRKPVTKHMQGVAKQLVLSRVG